jgi:hypothetical protein
MCNTENFGIGVLSVSALTEVASALADQYGCKPLAHFASVNRLHKKTYRCII